MLKYLGLHLEDSKANKDSTSCGELSSSCKSLLKLKLNGACAVNVQNLLDVSVKEFKGPVILKDSPVSPTYTMSERLALAVVN